MLSRVFLATQPQNFLVVIPYPSAVLRLHKQLTDDFLLALKVFFSKIKYIRLTLLSLEVFAREPSCRLANFSIKCDELVENTIKMEPNIMQSYKVKRLNKVRSETKLLHKEISKEISEFTS